MKKLALPVCAVCVVRFQSHRSTKTLEAEPQQQHGQQKIVFFDDALETHWNNHTLFPLHILV